MISQCLTDPLSIAVRFCKIDLYLLRMSKFTYYFIGDQVISDFETSKRGGSCSGLAEILNGTDRRLAFFPDISVHWNRYC